MTDREESIFRRLRERSPAIADVYASGLRLIEDPTFPARCYHIAHACREIRNALPELYGVEPDTARRIGSISSRWTDSVSELLGEMADSPEEPIPVPRDIAEHIDRMIKIERDVAGKLRRRFGAMCDVVNPTTLHGFTDSSLGVTWTQARPDRLAHVARTPYAEAPSPDEAIDVFRRIENVLAALYATADVALPLLEELIREANEG